MPHDAHGNPIQAGDKVVIPATVLAVHEAPEFCNCDLEFDHVTPGRDAKDRYSAINTRQVEKALTVGVAAADAGEAAYNGYLASCGGTSLISGQRLPTWAEQAPAIQTAWRAAAAAVLLFSGKTELRAAE